MKKIVYNAFFPICLISLLLLSIITISLNRSFYNRQYVANDTPAYTGLSFENLEIVTDNLLDYLVGQRDNLDMELSVGGEMREIFDEREKTHMVDVQKLYLTVVYTTAALLAVIILSAVIMYKDKARESLQSLLFSKYKKSLIVAAVLVIILGAIFYINFNWFWTNFHLVFFSNDLWILDPAISVMINMFPLDFFFSICRDILIGFFAGCTVIYLILMPKKWIKKL